jgi:uncharacterized protein YkwD
MKRSVLIVLVLFSAFLFGPSVLVSVFNKKPTESTVTITPSVIVSPTSATTPIKKEVKAASSVASNPTGEWGVPSKTSNDTWTMKINSDSKTSTPRELFDALNQYRSVHGKSTLAWNDKLAQLAQYRAEQQAKLGKGDEHAGLNEYFANKDNFKAIGFSHIAENSSYGFQLSGVHLIEWMYAADAPHNNNQLSSSWSDVGVGISGTFSDIVFGGHD